MRARYGLQTVTYIPETPGVAKRLAYTCYHAVIQQLMQHLLTKILLDTWGTQINCFSFCILDAHD